MMYGNYDEDSLINVAEQLVKCASNDYIVGKIYLIYRFNCVPEEEVFKKEIKKIKSKIYKRFDNKEKHAWVEEILKMKRYYECRKFFETDPLELFTKDISDKIFEKLDGDVADRYDEIIARRRKILNWN